MSHKGPCEREAEGQGVTDGSRGWSDVATNKGCGWPLEAGNGKGMDSPLELPEGTSPANTLILAPWDTCWTSGLQNCGQ